MGQGSARLCCFDGIAALTPPSSPAGQEWRRPGPTKRQAATYGELVLPPAPPGLPPLDVETHISGIATRTPYTSDVIAAIQGLCCNFDGETQALVKRHSVWCTEAVMVRFLIAREWHAQAAAKLLKEALLWRDFRKPDWVLTDPGTELARRFYKEAETGKIRVTGTDRYGRAVLVFDNSTENTKDDTEHMNFLAWNLMFAMRTMAPGADKICLVMHLDRFSLRNQPPLWVAKETIAMLTKAFPETLGSCVLYQPPAAFMQLYRVMKYLLDPKPAAKIHFIKGDCSQGTPNHAKLSYLIGENWQDLTGCGLKPLERRFSELHGHEIDCTPGFIRERYWNDVISRERAWVEEHPEVSQTCDGKAAAWLANSAAARADAAKPRKPSVGSGFCGVFSVAVAGMLVSAITVNMSVADIWLGHA